MPGLIEKKTISNSVRVDVNIEAELGQSLKRFQSALHFKGNRSREKIAKK